MEFKEWKWTTADGLEMRAGDWVPAGTPKGVVSVIHGVGEHIGRYQWDGEALTKAGYILTGFDLRGFGKSQGPRGHTPNPDAYFDDIEKFLSLVTSRYPGLPQFLYGHSMGSILALAYPSVRQLRVAGVIATAPGLKSELEKQKFKVFLAKILGIVVPTFAFQSGLDIPQISRDPKVVEDYINDPLVHTTVTAGWGAAMLTAIDLVYQLAPKFPLPLLLMHATEDKIAFPSSSTTYAELAPKDKVTLKMWEGFKHELHTDPEREQVFKFMVDWLDAHLPQKQ